MREVANQQQGLYRPEFEHDNCGIGAVVNIKGKKTHDTVANALKIVENLEHRAGKDAEGKTGDGVGILLQISHKFFKKVCKKEGFDIGGEREYGVAQLFFPQQEIKRAQAKKMFEIIVEKEGLELLGWRTVPVFPEVLGHKAKECMPCIMQAFVKKPEDVEKGLAFDRMLYIARREFEQSNDNTYVVSMNSRTIVYKGMFLVGQLRTFFGDLQSQDYESAIAVVHSRFSTNTNPSWERAHPNRFIVHNGEINTIRGNADKMLAREENMESPYLKDELHKVLPVVNRNGSDSAMLDNTLEFLVMSGMDLPLAVMITIPEPWANNDTISQEKRDFYQYYATMMEADNAARQEWNRTADMALLSGIEETKILEIKKEEIHQKASQSIKEKGWLPTLFRSIIGRAKELLQSLIREKDMPPKPTLDMDMAEFRRMKNLMIKAQEGAREIRRLQDDVLPKLKAQLADTKGLFKGKERKALSEQIQQTEKEIAAKLDMLPDILKEDGYPDVQAFMRTFREMESVVEQYSRDLAEWERQTSRKPSAAAKEQRRPPEKQSVLKHLREIQDKNRQKPPQRQRKKSIDRDSR